LCRASRRPKATGPPTGDDHVYLVAGTTFEKYRDFLLKELPQVYSGQLGQIAEQWRIASVYLLQLRRRA
jgi:hypothetical protein